MLMKTAFGPVLGVDLKRKTHNWIMKIHGNENNIYILLSLFYNTKIKFYISR